MNKKHFLTACLITLFVSQAIGQTTTKMTTGLVRERKFSLSTTFLVFMNFGEEKKNTRHYEFHLKYRLTDKDIVGVKAATWKLFAPMGIPLWDSLFLDESEFLPGRLRESGLGISYQRMLWKGLFATIEVLPLYKTYLDKENEKVGHGFKLYTSYHLGYHIALFKNRMFIEPQLHCNYWPVDTNIPDGFREMERKWNNYFLFEPNVYIGFKF